MKLDTGYYKRSYDDEWISSSEYLKIGKGFLSNNITYSIEGNLNAAKVLKLKLNINEADSAKKFHLILFETVII